MWLWYLCPLAATSKQFPDQLCCGTKPRKEPWAVKSQIHRMGKAGRDLEVTWPNLPTQAGSLRALHSGLCPQSFWVSPRKEIPGSICPFLGLCWPPAAVCQKIPTPCSVFPVLWLPQEYQLREYLRFSLAGKIYWGWECTEDWMDPSSCILCWLPAAHSRLPERNAQLFIPTRQMLLSLPVWVRTVEHITHETHLCYTRKEPSPWSQMWEMLPHTWTESTHGS